MKTWLIGTAAAFVIPVVVLSQQRDAGATPPVVIGNAEISGTVVSAETSPQPMRRAVVTITGGGSPRSVLTDDAGRFTFSRLTAGTYSVTARKAAYIAAPYGARRPGRAGVPVVLVDSQKADVRISMFRGAAVSGTLRDAAGLPVPGIDVRIMDARTMLTAPDSSPPELATTDDRGAFRLYGLLPGDYFLMALPIVSGQGEVVAPSASQVDNALAALSARGSLNPTPAAPSKPVQPVGFAPIYFPGTSNHAQAARIHLEPGEERAGVNFELAPVPMAAIEGVVSNIAGMTGVQVTIIPSGPRVSTGMSSNSLAGRALDAQGTFRYANLPPGSYRLVARARRGSGETVTAPPVGGGVSIGGGRGVGPPPPSVDYLYGFADVELQGEDVSGVTLALQPGGLITGRIILSGASPKPDDLSKVRVSLALEGNAGMVSSGGLTMGGGLVSSPAPSVRADGTFEFRGVGPGRFALASSFPTGADAGTWKLRSAMAGDRDLLDGLLEVGPGLEIKDVRVTFSDARTEISGSLQTSSGQRTTEYDIVALTTNRALWRPKSRRVLSVRPATDGRFVFGDLPAGEYVIAALLDLDPLDLMDPSFLEQIASAGVKVTVAEGERKVQDLRIR